VAQVALRGSDDRDLCALLSVQAGKAIDEAMVTADIHALFASRAVRDVVAVSELDAAGRTILAYELSARPSLREVRIEGISHTELLDAAAAARSSKPRWFEELWLAEACGSLEKALRDAGFRHARVEPRVEPSPHGTVDVVLRVTEGPRTLVSSIRFSRLRVLEERALRSELATTERSVLSEAALERDALFIAVSGYDRGLIEIRVEPPQVVESAAGDSAEVAFLVGEGPVYRLGKLAVAGEGALSPREYGRALSGLTTGSTFSRKAILEAMARIRAEHERRGSHVEVTPETQLDTKRKIVDLVLKLTPPSS